MAWLSTLETTLISSQARTVMAEALRAVANVLEKPQGEQGQGSGTQEGRDAVSAAGSLGAEIVAAPLEVAAAAIGAAGEVVTSALGVSSGEEGTAPAGRAAGGPQRRKNHRRRATSQPNDLMIGRLCITSNVKRPPRRRRPSPHRKLLGVIRPPRRPVRDRLRPWRACRRRAGSRARRARPGPACEA